MMKKFCPLIHYGEEGGPKVCEGANCEWWDVDDDCCCIRVAVRALEDICSFIGRLEAKAEDRGERP